MTFRVSDYATHTCACVAAWKKAKSSGQSAQSVRPLLACGRKDCCLRPLLALPSIAPRARARVVVEERKSTSAPSARAKITPCARKKD